MDPSYKDEKRLKKYIDMLGFMADSDEGIPTVCPCGGQIVTETETKTGKKYFICNQFEDDGMHRKKNWFEGVEEEIGKMKKEVDSQKSKIYFLERQVEQLVQEIKALHEKLGEN